MNDYDELKADLLKAAKCIHIAVDAPVAVDLSQKFIRAHDALRDMQAYSEKYLNVCRMLSDEQEHSKQLEQRIGNQRKEITRLQSQLDTLQTEGIRTAKALAISQSQLEEARGELDKQWIPIDDFPDDAEEGMYLTHWSDGAIETFRYDSLEHYFDGASLHNQCITHWMPLPTTPDDSED